MGRRSGSHGTLPQQLTSFIGRGHEIPAVTGLLATSRLVTLTGVGGVGKTRLALEVAGEVAGYPEGACLVELSPLADAGLVPQTVARALNLQEEAGRSITDTRRKSVASLP